MEFVPPERFTLTFEHREDGGLRVYSDDLRGIVLSHSDPRLVLADLKPVLEVVLTALGRL